MSADRWVFLFWLCVLLLNVAFALMFFWLGEWYGLRHPEVHIPPRPTLCPWCGGPLRSELVWSSVCRVCNRGQVGGFRPEAFLPEPKHGPSFVSHVDVQARHASDSPGGYPWKGL